MRCHGRLSQGCSRFLWALIKPPGGQQDSIDLELREARTISISLSHSHTLSHTHYSSVSPWIDIHRFHLAGWLYKQKLVTMPAEGQ